MKPHLTIGALANATGVPTSTIRYYERAGLLRPSARSESRYRLYSHEDLNRLRFIRAAQASGFVLDDVIELLRPAHCRNVQKLIERRLAQAENRLRDLRHVQKVLKASLKLCLDHEETGRCKVIETLSISSRSKQP